MSDLVSYLSWIFLVLFAGLLLYLLILRKQIRIMKSQLERRRLGNTNQPLSLELLSCDLTALSAEINRGLEHGRKIEAASKTKEKEFRNMIADLSHDLRTPLTAIKGSFQLIEQLNPSTAQSDEWCIAKKHVNEMERLTEKFWEYSYFSVFEQEIKLQRINLMNIVTECVADHVPQLEDKGLSVRFEQSKSVFVLADPEYATRIFLNLIQNCISHASGDIYIQVEAKCSEAVVSFCNTVSPDNELDVARIFERFYTADKSRRRSSGLGLAIVKLLAEKMGGDVSASLGQDMLIIYVSFQRERGVGS